MQCLLASTNLQGLLLGGEHLWGRLHHDAARDARDRYAARRRVAQQVAHGSVHRGGRQRSTTRYAVVAGRSTAGVQRSLLREARRRSYTWWPRSDDCRAWHGFRRFRRRKHALLGGERLVATRREWVELIRRRQWPRLGLCVPGHAIRAAAAAHVGAALGFLLITARHGHGVVVDRLHPEVQEVRVATRGVCTADVDGILP